MALPLEYPQFYENQRVESADLSALGSCAQENLYQALKALLGTGWLQPGTADWDSGMNCYLRAPVAAITAAGIAILGSDWAFAPSVGDATHPRIDLLSIGYSVVDADDEARPHKDPDTGVVTTPTVSTRKEINQTADIANWIKLTEGTPAASPARPATPANHVALWEVYVAQNATALSDSVFTPIASGITNKTPALSIAIWAGPGAAVQTLPYTTGTLLSVASKGSLTLLLATIHIVTQSTIPVRSGLRPLVVSIEDATSGTVVGRSEVHLQGGEYHTVTVFGTLAAPSQGTRAYRMRVAEGGSGASGDATNTYVVCPATYSDGVTAVTNVIAALSL